MTNRASSAGGTKRKLRWGYIIGTVILLAYALFVVAPLIWTTSIAFKPPEDFSAVPPRLWPSEFTLSHFRPLGELNAWEGLKNSLIVSISSSLISVTLGSLAGYALARYKTGGHNFSFWLISQRLMPPIAILVPIFLLIRLVGLVDSLVGLTLVYSLFSITFSAWIVRSSFIMIPDEYEQAAAVDGASRLQVIWHIMLPLGKSAILAAGAFAFVVSYTEYLFASILTRSDSLTLPVVISSFLNVQSTFVGELAAMVLISAVPAIAVGVLFYRQAAAGLTMGGVKG